MQAACKAEPVFDPAIAVIEILAGDRIISEQKAPPDDPIHHMDRRGFEPFRLPHPDIADHDRLRGNGFPIGV